MAANRPYGEYIKQTSSQEPLDGLESYLAVMIIFNSIPHVVSEKKIFEISTSQRLLWPLAAILDVQSEQKVTTIDQSLVRNRSTSVQDGCCY
jgi:hypothetical protein